jgi:23S rRNA pseudouridine2605 synthase
MRLSKRLARAGVASRRASEALIVQGRVTVAGEVVRDPARDVDASVEIAVDGRVLTGAEARVVYAVHKPVGVLSTAEDPFGRPIVVSLVAEERRLYPVGRLDLDSSGLILLTNDGELAHALTHPRFEVPKAYDVEVGGGVVSEDELARLRAGVELEDGITAPAEAERLARPSRGGGSADRARERLRITIREGRNRQVRRMCDAVGHPVVSLRRVAFGPLALGDLAPGASRRLSTAEVEALRAASPPALEESTR